MKTTILSLIMTIAMVLSFGNTTFAKDEKKTVVFKAELHCKSCKAKIEKSIPFEKGVKDLKVDMEAKTITIEYRADKTTEEKLIAAIEKCGVKVLGKECCEKSEGEHKHECGEGHKCEGKSETCKSKSCEKEKAEKAEKTEKTEKEGGCCGGKK